MNLEESLSQSADGLYLNSLNYDDQEPSYWQPIRHLEYTMGYIRKAGKQKITDDAKVRNTIIGLIDYWLAKDYTNKNNWYYNEIGVPFDLADISIMVKDYLTDAQLDKIAKILNRGTIGRGPDDKEVYGSNGTDFIKISIVNAVLTNDYNLLDTCMNRINALITKSDDKYTGIQEDMTYMGATVLYSGGSYSATYMDNISYFIYLLDGTAFNIREDKYRLFVDFILDGQYFFNMKDGVPQWSLGRSAYQASGGNYIRDALKRLLHNQNQYRIDELKAYYDSFYNDTSLEERISYFPKAGVLVYKGPSGYFAARGAADGVSLANVQINEGVLDYNYSYGSNTCYMKSGDEYSSLSPVFDFSMLPGTTTYYESDDTLRRRWKENYNKTWGFNEYVSPVNSHCDGKVDEETKAGIMVTELHHDDINGKNAFIIYKKRMYCLGTSFFNSEDDKSKEIITTIDQCESDDQESRKTTLSKGESITNASFRYTNLCENGLICEREMQSGTISRSSLNFPDSNTAQSHEVFKCYYKWGASLDEDSYAYSVSSLENEDSVDIKKIINTDNCQLIEFSDGMIIGYVYTSDFNLDGISLIHGSIVKKLK